MRKKQSDATRIIHTGADAGLIGKTVNPPVQRGSTVILPNAASLYDSGQVTYGRAGLQPHAALCTALADLEGAAGAELFPSGLAAMTGALLAVLKSGDEVLAVDCVYAPTRRFCDKVLSRFGISTRYFDPALGADEVLAKTSPETRLIILEAPGSLTFEMQDVPAIAAAARARGILTLIDNTWGAGLYYKPITHGVDISVQALTKYVGGHSDSFMGAACARDAALAQTLRDAVWQVGWSTSADDAYTMLRGLRTLPTRLARHSQNALAIADWLQVQPDVIQVLCPGLPDSHGHDIWKRDFTGQNGLLGFVLSPGPQAAVHALLDALELFGLGFSWGGYESLAINCDPQFDVRKFPPAYTGPMIRIHVGLEDVEDLKADLATALAAYAAAR